MIRVLTFLFYFTSFSFAGYYLYNPACKSGDNTCQIWHNSCPASTYFSTSDAVSFASCNSGFNLVWLTLPNGNTYCDYRGYAENIAKYECQACPSAASIDAQIATQSATCTAEGGVPHYLSATNSSGCPFVSGYCDQCAQLINDADNDCAALLKEDGDGDGLCTDYVSAPVCSPHNTSTGGSILLSTGCDAVGDPYDCLEGPPGSSSSGAGSSGSGSSSSGNGSSSGTSSGNGGSSNSGSSSSDEGAGSSDSNSSDSGTSSNSGGGGTSSGSDDWETDNECYNSYSEAQAAKYALETSCVAAGRSPAYAIGTGNCISGVCTNTGISSPSGGGETGTSSGSGGGDGGEGNWATPEDVWEVSHRVDSLRDELKGYDDNRHADQQATTDAIDDLTNRFAQGTDDVLKTLKEWGDSITGAIRGEGSGLGSCVDQFGNQYQCNTNDPGNGTGVGDWEGYFADGDSNGLGFDSVAGVDSGFYKSALGVEGSDSLTSNLGTLQTQIRTATATPFEDSKALDCPETFKADFCKWTENFGASPGQYSCVFDICDTRWSIGTANTKKHPFEIMGIILEMSAWLVFFTRIKVS